MTEPREVRRRVTLTTTVEGKINIGDYSSFTFRHSQERTARESEADIAVAERKLNAAVRKVVEERLGEYKELIDEAREESI